MHISAIMKQTAHIQSTLLITNINQIILFYLTNRLTKKTEKHQDQSYYDALTYIPYYINFSGDISQTKQ